LHTPFGNLINILQGKEIIPECMLLSCKASNIVSRLLSLMDNSDKCVQQMDEAQKSLQMLRPPDMLPSCKAAQTVLNVLRDI